MLSALSIPTLGEQRLSAQTSFTEGKTLGIERHSAKDSLPRVIHSAYRMTLGEMAVSSRL
uniref:Uncharacterized protein n=1 Tax=Zea mays TaxID=4577 RepID=B6T8W2_MAIZE|nr:hypothetical protein [Zea mays]